VPETATMARKKPKPAPAPEPKPEARPTALTIKGSLEWREWVQRAAKHCRTDTAKLVDAAIAEYARKRGFAEPAPER
jgi:hypothetical protein